LLNVVPELNGNEIPDELPAELVPPSHRDLDSSVNFVKNLLQNEPTRSRSPSGLDAPISRLPNRSLHSTSAPGAGGRQDATVYKHTDDEPAGGYYTPRSRHLDRSAVRASSERDSPAADLSDMKRQLENTARMLDRATEESALRTAEDDALDREMSDLKWKVQRVQEDLEYASRGPRSVRADEERRRLERELLQLMHERVPTVEKKLAEREERRARQKRDMDRERDRRNETFGRFSDRDRDRDRYGSSYSRDADDNRYGGGYDRDRGRDREYRDDRSPDFGRDRPYRERSRSWDRKYDRGPSRSSPVSARSPPPAPPPAASVASKSPPAAPTPGRSPAPNVKNMTPEERRAFIQAEAQRRTAERMAAMGLSAPPPSSSPKPSLDTSTEDRLAREKREAEEKARAAEEAAAERARQRDERLKNERGEGTSTPTITTATAQIAPAVVPKVPPPVKPRAPAPPPPRKPGLGAASRSLTGRLPAKTSPSVTSPPVSKPSAPLPVPAPPVIDPEEEELRAREEALRQQKEERLARMRRLEEEEREEKAQRQREEDARLQREQEEAARKAKQERLERLKRMEEEEAEEARREDKAREAIRARTPAPAPVAPPPAPVVPPVPPPPPAPPVTSPMDRGKNNPFNRLINSGASPAAPSPQVNGNNPFFRSQPGAPPVPSNNDTTPLPPGPTPSIPNPPPASKSPAPPVVKTSYHTAPGDSEDEWGQEKDGDDSSEDELNSSRDTRDKLARQLFGSILPPASVPPRPQSAAAGASATPKASTPTAPTAPTPPPPPPPPSAPPAPAALMAPVSSPNPAGDRGALFNAIQSGTRLRKAVTDDRSASAISGRVIGDDGPPPHISAIAPILPAEISHSEKNVTPSRQSVDWYMGLAADQGTHASQEPSLSPMGEEEEEQVGQGVNGHAALVPDIRIAHAEGVESGPLEDLDRSTGVF
jgi:hypothetical protein